MGTLEQTTKTPTTPPRPRGRRPVGEWCVQAVLAAIGIYVVTSSSSLGIWSPEGPGPGFFPMVLAAGLILLSGVWLLQSVRELSAAFPDDGEEPTGPVETESVDGGTGQRTWRNAAITIVSLVVLASVLELIGFQLAMFLFLMFHLRLLGRVRWFTSVVVAVVGSVGAFHLFSDFLLVPLPLASVPPLSLWGF